jgi:hypothetical protein
MDRLKVIIMRFLKWYFSETWPLLAFCALLIFGLSFIEDNISTIFIWIISGLMVAVLIGRYIEFKRDKI